LRSRVNENEPPTEQKTEHGSTRMNTEPSGCTLAMAVSTDHLYPCCLRVDPRSFSCLLEDGILAAMERLWTPWRYDYITRSDTSAPSAREGVPAALSAWSASGAPDIHCVFCNMIASVDYAIAHGMAIVEAEQAAHILHRGARCFLCLNAFPYATGHILILPYVHQDSLAALDPLAAQEMMALAQQVERALRAVYRPAGMNFGMNLGEAGGAGVTGHIHLHALPRWIGDTNFMTVTANTRVLPETLDRTWARVREALTERCVS
jgi:ATP adenylyltransferase